MTSDNKRYSYLATTALFLFFAMPAFASPPEEETETIRCDPAEVLGAESCIKCHASECQQWKKTPHFATLEALHRKPEAKAIAKRLGLRSIKRNDVCVKCHYTQQLVGDRVRVVSGISCESCHGASKNWVKLHNDYGGENITKEMESAEHRVQRRKKSVAAGMNNPANLYLIARQCLACHTAPDERLVNVGEHPAGSKEFELVGWSQGMVRHNFLLSDGTINRKSSQTRLRVMFVVGVMADLEASLRATAQATVKAPYGIAAARRAVRLKRKLHAIGEKVDNPHIAQALDAALSAQIKLNNRAALLAAADEVGRAALAFAEDASGDALEPLDTLLPDAEQYKTR